jgi:hypothetical protein
MFMSHPIAEESKAREPAIISDLPHWIAQGVLAHAVSVAFAKTSSGFRVFKPRNTVEPMERSEEGDMHSSFGGDDWKEEMKEEKEGE